MNRIPYPRRSWWRLWTLQASWNQESLQGPGWMFVLEPWMRRRSDASEVRHRHAGPANTNPYLAGLVLGVVMRLEDDGEPELATTAAQSLSRTVGAIGDGLFWKGLRPCFALAAAVAVVGWGSSFAVWIAWLGFLGVSGWARVWSLERGYGWGKDVARRLSGSPLHAWTRSLSIASWLLAAGLAGLWLADAVPASPVAIGASVVGAAGAWRRWDGANLMAIGFLLVSLGLWVTGG